jgi:integrase
MSTKRQRASGNWEYVIKRKGVLKHPVSLTFSDEVEGDRAVAKYEAMLARGVVPLALSGSGSPPVQTVADAIREYQTVTPVGASDKPLLAALSLAHATVSLSAVNYSWVEQWVSKMKREQRLAPGTIRHYVGALSRCLNWCVRKNVMLQNPLLLLPRGYATYTEADGQAAGGRKEDQERDRRISVKEETAIREAIGAYAIPEDRPFLDLMFTLAVETAMRMRETYTLTTDQIDLKQRTIFLDKTKNNSKRQVPMSSVVVKAIKAHNLKQKAGTTCSKKQAHESAATGHTSLLFPWWDGKRESLDGTTFRLSRVWAGVFEAAGCEDLRYHDLRHHAVCQFYERTTMSDLEISRITGHRSLRMLRRYANLRGSTLAGKLW